MRVRSGPPVRPHRPQERATLEQGWGPGQRVAAVAIAGGIDATQVDVGAELGGGRRQ